LTAKKEKRQKKSCRGLASELCTTSQRLELKLFKNTTQHLHRTSKMKHKVAILGSGNWYGCKSQDSAGSAKSNAG
jgi:hypothetical protein